MTLAGYEVREYLLEKWGRKCAYCKATNVPLQIEHIVPKVRDGSHRVSNLTIACKPCNDAKGTRTAAEFGYPQIQAQARAPLRDAAAVNATRWALYHRLAALGLPLETGTGGRTKWNRTTRELPKTHWLDAACVGASTPAAAQDGRYRAAADHGDGAPRRQMCRTNAQGSPTKRPRRPAWSADSAPGTSCGPSYREQRQGGRLRGPDRGAGDGLMQYQDGERDRAGHARALLPAAPARRWLYLRQKGGGASSPGLKPGVSAPHI